MTRICAIALLALFASAAAASDRHEQLTQAYQAHLDCAFDAAMLMIDEKGTPEAIARKAVAMCADKEKSLGWYGAHAVRTATRRLIGILRSERKVPDFFRGKPRSRPVADLPLFEEPFPRMCASVGCGMSPTVDPKTKVWRPYRQ